MHCPTLPNEGARLAALRSYNILDTAPEHAFDRLTRLARMALQTPIVLVSLVDRDRQWFKSNQGVAVSETPRSVSFCGHAIHQVEPFIVPDATRDPRFHDNPLVLGEPFIRFYIGIPLVTRSGHVIGTLCAMDSRPRTLSPEEIDVMQDLASMVVDAIELRRLATADSLTGALTRRGFDTEIGREFGRAKRSGTTLAILAVDIDHFKAVNDRYGHAAGDAVLKSLVKIIKSELRLTDFIGRMGGEEFAVALPDTDLSGAAILAERIRARIASTEIDVQGSSIRISVSIGVAVCDMAEADWTMALRHADMALYGAKASGRNRCLRHDPASESAAA